MTFSILTKCPLGAKSKCILFSLCIFFILSLVGCTPKVKSEDELNQDLLNSTVFDMFLQGGDRDALPFSITNFTIRKRQTDNKNKRDVVYADFDIMRSDGSASGVGSCVMTYGLYNEGWLLDEVFLDKPLQLSPLSFPSITEEDLLSVVQQFYPGSELSECSIYGQDCNLENKIASYCLTVKAAHTYMDEFLDITCYYSFDEYGPGGWILDSCITNSTREDWSHLLGDYIAEPSTCGGNVGRTISIYNTDFEGDGTLKNMSWQILWWDGNIKNRASEELVDVRNMSPRELFYGLNLITPTARECIEKGYSVIVDNENWNDIIYVPDSRLYGYNNALFVGKDAVFLRLGNTIDHLNHTVHISCCQLPPIAY